MIGLNIEDFMLRTGLEDIVIVGIGGNGSLRLGVVEKLRCVSLRFGLGGLHATMLFETLAAAVTVEPCQKP